jgi:hypothetical protein
MLVVVRIGSVATVVAAGVAYEDRLLLDRMPTLAMGGARVDGVLVILASAYRVAFNDLVAHVGYSSAGSSSASLRKIKTWRGVVEGRVDKKKQLKKIYNEDL